MCTGCLSGHTAEKHAPGCGVAAWLQAALLSGTPPLPRLRLTQELSGDAMLARLVQVQNLRLRDMAMQGLEHPAFQQGQQQGQVGLQQ